MKNKNAFTLLEMLIVVAIIGIISTFLFPYVNKSVNDAKYTKAKQDFSAIKDIIQYHYLSGLDKQGEHIAPLEEDSLILLDYFHDNGDFENKTDNERFHAINALDYLGKNENVSVPVDPWGMKYSVLVRSETLPDQIDIDFSKGRYHITKIFQLDLGDQNDLYIGKKVYFYALTQPVPNTGPFGSVTPPAPIEKDAISLEFIYRYYYTQTKVAPYPELRDMVLYMTKQMEQSTTEVVLTPNSLGFPDESKRYATWKKAYLTIPTTSIADIQDYSLYFSIELPSTTIGNPNETKLEINGLIMRARLPYNSKTLTSFSGTLPVWALSVGYAGWVDLYHSSFNGKVDIKIISAGPDREFNTYDDISSDYSLKLNF